MSTSVKTPQDTVGTPTVVVQDVPLSLLASVDIPHGHKAGDQFDAMQATAENLGLAHFPADDREDICRQIGIAISTAKVGVNRSGVRITGAAKWADIGKACGLEKLETATLVLCGTLIDATSAYLKAVEQSDK